MSANPIDLTTLANVKSWINATGTSADQTIQDCITAFSAYALHQCGRGPADGSIPATSPFVIPTAYDEFYDGNGNDTLPLRNWPITAVTLVNAQGITIPLSASFNTPGYVIDQSKKFIVIRGYSLVNRYNIRAPQYCRMGFPLGTQNVEVQYTAGFSGVPFDLEMVARKVVALNYKRTGWIGQKAQAMAAGAGTISFNTFEMDPQDMKVMAYYQARVA